MDTSNRPSPRSLWFLVDQEGENLKPHLCEMAIEGEGLLDPPFLTKDKTCGVDEIEVLVFVFLVKFPGFLLNLLVEIGKADNTALQDFFSHLDPLVLADPFGNQRESIGKHKIRSDKTYIPH